MKNIYYFCQQLITLKSNLSNDKQMKKLLTLAVTMAIAISAAALPYSQARTEALFLSDKMAYELGLSLEQYEAVYEINFDYFYSVNSHSALYGIYWQRRNIDLQYVLSPFQYQCYQVASYFYRPLTWYHGSWRFAIRNRYTVSTRIYMGRPSAYSTYRGGRNKPRRSYYQGRSFNQPAAPNPQNPYPGKNNRGGTHNQPNSFDHNNAARPNNNPTTRPSTSNRPSTGNKPSTGNRPNTSNRPTATPHSSTRQGSTAQPRKATHK